MSAISLYDQMKEILDDVERVTTETAERVTKKVATRTAKKLKAVSPGPARYNQGWRSKRLDEHTFVVYNANVPGFTQLLENGHVIRNQYGEYGRAKPIKHIEPVEQEEVQDYIDEITKELDRNL